MLDYVGLLNRGYFLSSQDYCEVRDDYCDIFPPHLLNNSIGKNFTQLFFPSFLRIRALEDLPVPSLVWPAWSFIIWKLSIPNYGSFPALWEACSFLLSLLLHSSLWWIQVSTSQITFILFPSFLNQIRFSTLLSAIQFYECITFFLTQKSLFNKYHSNS